MLRKMPAPVSALVKNLGLTFPVAIDPDGAVSDIAYQVRGIPTTIFVDANGVVTARHTGPLDEATIEAYLAPLLAVPQAVAVEDDNSALAMVNQELADSLPQLVEGDPPNPAATSLPVKPAPDFTLPAAGGQVVALGDYLAQGSSVVLVFYRGHT
jgi:hypothetical protein